MKTNNTVGLYLHIPFCQKKCHYCDFLTFVNRDDTIHEYVNYLIKEIQLYKDHDYSVDTIYFGGGTPSHIDADYIAEIMQAIDQNFNILPECEISIEMNPESVSREKLTAYVTAGLNRFSMGVQSFDDQVLKMMGRLHNRQSVLEKIDLMAELEVGKFGIDLMFANPRQSLEVLKEDLAIAARLPVNHISYYSLMIKDNTPFHRWIQTGQIKLVDEETERYMYHLIQEKLTAHGFHQYEISNFAKKGAESRHNKKYWTLEDYIGLGLGASSNIGLERSVNQHSFTKYFDMIDKGKLPVQSSEKLSGEEREKEYIMLHLRLLQGFDIDEINQRFKINFIEKYQDAIEKHLNYQTVGLKDNRFYFTPRGLDIGNQFYLDIL